MVGSPYPIGKRIKLGEIEGCAESISRELQSRENDVKAYEMAV